MRCPDLFTSRLKRRRADSMGSPSPTTIFTLGVRLSAVLLFWEIVVTRHMKSVCENDEEDVVWGHMASTMQVHSI